MAVLSLKMLRAQQAMGKPVAQYGLLPIQFCKGLLGKRALQRGLRHLQTVGAKTKKQRTPPPPNRSISYEENERKSNSNIKFQLGTRTQAAIPALGEFKAGKFSVPGLHFLSKASCLLVPELALHHGSRAEGLEEE